MAQDKLKVISDFPRPANITELRSFMGLVEQLAGFSAVESGRLQVLVNTDRLPGWRVIHRWHHAPTARDLIQAVTSNFVDLGVPTPEGRRFRSDGGPKFGANALQTALRNWGVQWQNSSPYYAQSNGHAETAVDAMKRLVEKIAPVGDLNSDDFLQGLLEFRNTPRENGLSPPKWSSAGNSDPSYQRANPHLPCDGGKSWKCATGSWKSMEL